MSIIVKRPTHKKIARERKRLRKFRNLLDKGAMSEFDIHNAYKSWRNTIIKDCNACKRTIKSIDDLYEDLFPEHEKYVRQKRCIVLDEIRKENIDEICRCKRERTFSTGERVNGLY